MEHIKDILKQDKGETSTSLQKYSTSTLIHCDEGETFLSVYVGSLTPENILATSKRILGAFPNIPNSFVDLLIMRAKEKGFSDDRLRDAVNHVIDTCQYPVPTLANFLSFDKRVKILDYNELCTLVGKGEVAFDSYTGIRIAKKLFWVKKSDKQIFNLPDEL